MLSTSEIYVENKNDWQTTNNYIERYSGKFLAYRFIDPK